jgi:chorismate mutase
MSTNTEAMAQLLEFRRSIDNFDAALIHISWPSGSG